ncbi:hypothetical protein MP228_002771 [Amoeboaphelidium protococcarum]|nr:hypothetical protein MP228_002771 [Amoeboaphelidium protococcarum]
MSKIAQQILSQKPVAAGITAYFGAVNAVSYGLFYKDKVSTNFVNVRRAIEFVNQDVQDAAINHQWRIPEKTLQLSALAGGWMCGMLAMQHFRHKTKKEPFRTIYFSCAAANIGLISLAAYVITRRPHLLNQLQSSRSLAQHNTPTQMVYPKNFSNKRDGGKRKQKAKYY